jgi:uncharacterized membrane protein YoaK (UPF0700 family)
MKSVDRATICDVLLLSFAAGSSDAAGYMGLGRVFTSNMTGNIVLLGIDAGQLHFTDAVRSLFVLGCFGCGVWLGAWMGLKTEEKDWPRLARRLLGLEALALILFAAGWMMVGGHAQAAPAYGFLLLLAVAMGLQSAALTRLKVPGVQTTAVTSTLTALVSGSARLFALPFSGPAQDAPTQSRILFLVSVLCLYCLGAIISGALFFHGPRWLGVAPAALVLAVALRQSRRI